MGWFSDVVLDDWLGINPPKDPSAQYRAGEAARQKRVDEGAARIRGHFARFTPEFYEGIARKYENYATPMVNEEFGGLGRAIKAAIHGAGLRGSSIAAQEQARLDRQRDDAQREIRSTGLDYANRHRANVTSSFSNLLSQNAALGDAEIAGDIALREADSLADIPKFEPILTAFARGSELVKHQQNLERESARFPYIKRNRYDIFNKSDGVKYYG